MLQISTNNLNTRKKVEIDGHVYTVRRMGAGDQLTVSQYMRELSALAEKEKKTPLDDKEIARIGEIEKSTFDISVNCFDDGGDGSKSRALVNGLSNPELVLLMGTIFENESTEVS